MDMPRLVISRPKWWRGCSEGRERELSVIYGGRSGLPSMERDLRLNKSDECLLEETQARSVSPLDEPPKAA